MTTFKNFQLQTLEYYESAFQRQPLEDNNTLQDEINTEFNLTTLLTLVKFMESNISEFWISIIQPII